MFRIAFVPGVTMTRWTRAWDERRADTPLQVSPTPEDRQVAVLRDGLADVSFVRLRHGEGAAREPDNGLSVIRLYEEVPVAVLPTGHPLEQSETVTLAELAGYKALEAREPLKEAVELVAAGVGVLVLPQAVARLYNRKDVVARPVTDAPETTIALVWIAEQTSADTDEFVGIVRGRGARSSRTTPTPATPRTSPRTQKTPPGADAKQRKRSQPKKKNQQRPASGKRRRSW